jgi:hypothetical protein
MQSIQMTAKKGGVQAIRMMLNKDYQYKEYLVVIVRLAASVPAVSSSVVRGSKLRRR